MVRKLIAKYIGFPLQDRVMKTTISKTTDFLLTSQFWNSKQIEEYKFRKFKQLITHCYIHVPYYRNLFTKNNMVPGDFSRPEDIQRIPILTKELLLDNHNSLLSEKAEFKYIRKGKTGGTTGTPVITYKDTAERSFTWASYYRWYNRMGISKEDKVLIFWGAGSVYEESGGVKLKKHFKNSLLNNLFINAFSINNRTLPLIYKKLISYNPILLKGYLSAILDLAIYMRTNNLSSNKSLKAISTTTETLLPMHRSLIEEVFKVKIFDQYGCGEVGGIAYECVSHEGLHVTEEHVLFETLDDYNKPVLNQTGKVTVTSLDNYAMPLIRYQNGDLATLSSEKCSCGLNEALIKSIEGRSIDTIRLTNGSNVHGVFFTSLFYDLGITARLITRFQVEQLESGEITIKLEATNSVPAELINKIRTEVSRFVSIESIQVLAKLQAEKNGKFRYIKSYSPKLLHDGG